MEKAPGSPRGSVAYEQAHLSILAVRPSERAEVDALRSMFTVPGPLGVLRAADDAVAIRVDGVPNKELNRIAGLYDLTRLDELVDIFDGRRYWISLDPDAGLDEELVALGYVRDGAWQKFERGLEPLEASTDLEIAEARSAVRPNYTASGAGSSSSSGSRP